MANSEEVLIADQLGEPRVAPLHPMLLIISHALPSFTVQGLRIACQILSISGCTSFKAVTPGGVVWTVTYELERYRIRG